MNESIDAIYYPWIAISNLDNLKKALVYFDKIYLICPPTVDDLADGFNTVNHRTSAWNEQQIFEFEAHLKSFFQFRKETQSLVSEGVLEFVDPYKFGVPSLAQTVEEWSSSNLTGLGTERLDSINAIDPEYEEKCRLLTKAISSDFSQPDFCNLPTTLRTFIAMGWMFDYGASGSTLSEFYGYDLRKVMIGQGTTTPDTLYLDLSEFSSDGRSKWRSDIAIDVESYVAQSLIINRTLFAAAELRAVPFTDQIDHFAFMEEKFLRLSKSPEMRELIGEHFPECNFEEHALGSRIVETQLPNLDGFNWDDILTIRDRAGPELERFRAGVAALGTIVSVDRGGDLHARIQNVIKKHITPAILDLENSLKLSRVKVVKDAFTKAQSIKPAIPFSVSVFAGIPIEISLLVSAGVLATDAALEAYVQRKEIRSSSSLGYLLNFR